MPTIPEGLLCAHALLRNGFLGPAARHHLLLLDPPATPTATAMRDLERARGLHCLLVPEELRTRVQVPVQMLQPARTAPLSTFTMSTTLRHMIRSYPIPSPSFAPHVFELSLWKRFHVLLVPARLCLQCPAPRLLLSQHKVPARLSREDPSFSATILPVIQRLTSSGYPMYMLAATSVYMPSWL